MKKTAHQGKNASTESYLLNLNHNRCVQNSRSWCNRSRTSRWSISIGASDNVNGTIQTGTCDYLRESTSSGKRRATSYEVFWCVLHLQNPISDHWTWKNINNEKFADERNLPIYSSFIVEWPLRSEFFNSSQQGYTGNTSTSSHILLSVQQSSLWLPETLITFTM